MKVITYQAPSGSTINLTPRQCGMLERAGTWPRNSRGEEFCSVSHGLHVGEPTYSDQEISNLIDPPPRSGDAREWDAWRLRGGISGCHH